MLQAQDFIQDDILSPTLIADALRTSKSEIADTLGLAKDALSRKSKLGANTTQTRLCQMLEILRREAGPNGSLLAAYAWSRSERLPGFGGMTPSQLLRDGKASNVHDHLDRIADGGYV